MRISLYFVLIFIILLSSIVPSIANDRFIKIVNEFEVFSPGSVLSNLEDSIGNWTVDSLLVESRLLNFQEIGTAIFSKPPSYNPQWFKLSIQNNTKEPLWMEIHSLFAWDIQLYLLDSNNKYKFISQSGLKTPKSERLYPHHFWLPLSHSSDSTIRTYVFRIKFGGPMECPVSIGSLNALHKEKSYRDIFDGAFLGLVFVMMIYNLILYIFIKDRVYIYYVLYLFFMSFCVSYGNGFPLPDILYPSMWWHEHLFVWFFPAFLSMSLFCIQYLELHKRDKLFFRMVLAGVVLFATLAALNIWYDSISLSSLYILSVLIICSACLLSGYKSLIKGYIPARFFVGGWTLVVFSILIYFLTLFAYIPYNFITRNITYFAIAGEIILFAVALADRINTAREKHKKAQDELMKAISLNESIVIKHNEELELQVNTKTQELKEKAENLESAYKEISTINEELKATIDELHLALNKVNEQSAIIKSQSDHIQEYNLNLERLISEKSNVILIQNEQLRAYAHANSHKVRGPLARILGLISLISVEVDKKKFRDYLLLLEKCALELDIIIKEMNAILLETDYYNNHSS